jgi:hypothetical protein
VARVCACHTEVCSCSLASASGSVELRCCTLGGALPLTKTAEPLYFLAYSVCSEIPQLLSKGLDTAEERRRVRRITTQNGMPASTERTDGGHSFFPVLVLRSLRIDSAGRLSLHFQIVSCLRHRWRQQVPLKA